MEKSKSYTEAGLRATFWYLPSKGKEYFHRLDGPAKEFKYRKEWWVNNKRHRIDGYASITSMGDREWWINGKRHRIGGPAILRHDRSNGWYMDGKLHRLDGPAIEYTNGRKEWYINGMLLDKNKIELWIEENNIDLKTEAGLAALKLRFS